MTDAALAVTERAVERLTETYLTSIGADIHKDGRRWTVSLPDEAETDLELDGTTLVVTTDPDEVGDDAVAVAPQSRFVERLIDEAAERNPVSTLALTGETVAIHLPPWLTEGGVDIVDQEFTPYYDRRAICALFHVGIETVSEYQSEELCGVAIDLNGNDRQPKLAQTYLDVAEGSNDSLATGPTLDRDRIQTALSSARQAVEEDVARIVEDTRKRATRAADVELEEYREYARLRRDELTAEIERLTERIEEVTERIENVDVQGERVEALRERKQLRTERDDLRTERDDLQEEIEAGFPKRRRKIRHRHALTVRMRPVTLAAISYERGDLTVTLRDAGTTVNASFGYAIGVGITDNHHCDRCGDTFTEANPISLDGTRLVGANCCR